MQITDIKIRKFFDEGPMKAIVSVTFEDCLAVHDIKVIENEDKVFVAMPNRRMKDGTFKDVAHPVNFETRKYIEEIIINAYNEAEEPAEEF
jgi:stage V sporulation protein G